MAGENLLVENAAIVCFDSPKNAVANSAEWVNMANFAHITIIMMAEGVIGQTTLFAIIQAQDNTGTGSKALTFQEHYLKSAADITTVAVFTKVEATASTIITTANEEFQAVVEYDAEDLDVVNGFTHVSCIFTDPGAVDHAIAAIGILGDPRYRQGIIGTAID